MAVPVGSAFIDVRPDLTGFGRELRAGITRDLQGVGDETARTLRSSLAGAGRSMAAGFGAAFAASKITGFLGDTVRAASELTEVGSTAETVFGAAFAQVDRWAKQTADSIGLSRKAALEASAGFGNLFTQVGFTGDAAFAMSKQLIEAGVDLRSAFDGQLTDVIAAIGSSFRGEFDPLQRYIPLINAAAVEQQAMAATGKRNAASLTAQEKAAATAAFIMGNLGAAAGDYARTSDSLANQQQRLNAQWEDLQTELGEGLIPLMVDFTSLLNDTVVPAFKTLFLSTGADATGWVSTLRNVIGDVGGFILGAFAEIARGVANFVAAIPGPWGEGFARDLRRGADGMDEARKKLHASTAELLAWKGAGDEATDTTKALTGATGALTGQVVDLSDQLTKSLPTALGSMLDPLKRFGAEAAENLGLSDVKRLLDDDKEWEGSYRKLSAAAKAGLEPADKAAKDQIVTLKDLKGNLRANVTAAKDWVADLKSLATRSGGAFQSVAAELAGLGPEGAKVADELVGASDATLREIQGLFAERRKLLGDETVKTLVAALAPAGDAAGQGFIDGFRGKVERDLWTGWNGPKPPHDLWAGWTGPKPPGPDLWTGWTGPKPGDPMPAVSFPAGAPGSLGGGVPSVRMPTQQNISVNVQAATNADPHQIATTVGDHLSWRLGPKPTLVG